MSELLSVVPYQSEPALFSRERQVIKLWENDLLTPDCVGYHCTSLETIQYMIATGVIPGHTETDYDDLALTQKGDVYFLPRMETFPFTRLPQLLNKDRIQPEWGEFALTESVETAIDVAMGHRFCSYLGLDLATYSFWAEIYAREYGGNKKTTDYWKAKKAFADLQLRQGHIVEAVKAARKRRGIVIGLTNDALNKFPLSEGDEGTDFRLSTGENGLPIDCLSGLRTLGYEEMMYFYHLFPSSIQII